jgi:SnoaL-like domain
MTDRAAIAAWVRGYERAWRTAGTDALEAVFTEEASYSMEPYDEPVGGLEAIGALWERERSGPDEAFTMEWDIVAAEGDVAVLRVDVDYPDKHLEFRDLWIVEFAADGRCRSFAEWPFWPDKGYSESSSAAAKEKDA